MKITKLNNKGFAHHFVLVFVVLAVAIGGTAYLVASHADTPCSGMSDPVSGPVSSPVCGTSDPASGPVSAPVSAPTSSGWTFIGKRTFLSKNEVLNVYACSEKPVQAVRTVEALFSLSNAYNTSNGFVWTASVINASSAALPNNQSVYQTIPSAQNASTLLKLNVSTRTTNPLSFSYSAGTPVKGGTVLMGNVAQNRHPANFAACLDKS